MSVTPQRFCRIVLKTPLMPLCFAYTALNDVSDAVFEWISEEERKVPFQTQLIYEWWLR